VTIDGELYVIFASESVGGPCYAYTGRGFSRREVVWESAGGTMSLIQIPGTNGEFLAVQNFFPGFKSQKAKIVWGRRSGNSAWETRDVLSLPFLHRFDVFRVEGVNYFLGATLCTSKKDREDWSDPGKVYAGVLPDNFDQSGNSFEISPIMEGMYRNHGYWRGSYDGRDAGFVTSDSGIYAILPPLNANGKFDIRLIMGRPVGDAALFDLDGDGVDELVTIEPFHGDGVYIYKLIGNEYKKVYEYPGEIEFAHVIWAGLIRGAPTVIGGVRRRNCELFYIQCLDYELQKYESSLIESGVGTSNVAVVSQGDMDILISANHTKNEAALYIFS
jgi:hypothetical protein